MKVDYQQAIFNLKCMPDLLALGLYPNMKEWAESYGLFSLVRSLIGAESFKKDYDLVVVGDGVLPRTATLFAFMTRWSCYSMDPALRWTTADLRERGVERLWLYQRKVEDATINFVKPTIIIMPHSHAHESAVLEHLIADQMLLISMPCCNDPDIDTSTAAHITLDIPTPKNKVYIWNFTDGETKAS